VLGNIILAYRFQGFRVFAQLENLLNAAWNEAQFDTESRLYNEPAPLSELHFTPGNPRNIQAGISLEF
jgi:outer membrane receptor protein involved in Fe transport